MSKEDIKQMVEEADHERVHVYMDVFDRILLYTLAANLLPKEAIDASVDLWNIVVKRGIDDDVSKRTNFLESTTSGRAAKLRNEPDGEDLRMHCLKQWEIARNVILANLKYDKKDDNFGDIDLL